MSLFTFFARFFLRRRENAISYFTKNPIDHQKQIFDSLIKKGTATSYGKEFDFVNIKSYEEYSAIVPVVDYEVYFKNIKMVLEGKTNIIWPSKIKWFAKSSGTTNDVSKFIPVSEESLNLNHMKAWIEFYPLCY